MSKTMIKLQCGDCGSMSMRILRSGIYCYKCGFTLMDIDVKNGVNFQ